MAPVQLHVPTDFTDAPGSVAQASQQVNLMTIPQQVPGQVDADKAFRTGRAGLSLWGCDKTDNVYSGTVFEGRRLSAEQVGLLLRGVIEGAQAQILANEVGVSAYGTSYPPQDASQHPTDAA